MPNACREEDDEDMPDAGAEAQQIFEAEPAPASRGRRHRPPRPKAPSRSGSRSSSHSEGRQGGPAQTQHLEKEVLGLLQTSQSLRQRQASARGRAPAAVPPGCCGSPQPVLHAANRPHLPPLCRAQAQLAEGNEQLRRRLKQLQDDVTVLRELQQHLAPQQQQQQQQYQQATQQQQQPQQQQLSPAQLVLPPPVPLPPLPLFDAPVAQPMLPPQFHPPRMP